MGFNLKFAIFFLVLTGLLIGCANRQTQYYSNSGSNSQSSSIPAYQYDSAYRNGCNTAIFNHKNGFYNGSFCYGKRSGRGSETYKDPPSKYEGNFVDDLRSGWGVYVWTDTNNSYKGYFKNGSQHGQGTFIWSNGSYLRGLWTNGVKTGDFEFYTRDDKLVGTYTYNNDKLVTSKKVPDSSAVSASPAPEKPSSAYVDPVIVKTQKCKRIGLVEGTDDFSLCLKSLKN